MAVTTGSKPVSVCHGQSESRMPLRCIGGTFSGLGLNRFLAEADIRSDRHERKPMKPSVITSARRENCPPRWLSALGIALLGLPAFLGITPASQAAAPGGGSVPAFSSGYRVPSQVNAGTVVASGGSPQVNTPINAGTVAASGGSPQISAPILAGTVAASGAWPQINAPINAGTVAASGGSPQINAPIVAGTVIAQGSGF